MDKNIISLDMEFNQPSNKIIQIGYVVGNIKTGEILYQKEDCVKSDEIVSEYITKLTNIKTSDVQNGKPLEEVYNDLKEVHTKYDCFRNCMTWGGGDSELIRKELGLDNERFLFGRRWIDVKTIYIAYRWGLGLNGQGGLAKACIKLGLQFKGRKHTAGDDALNTFYVFRELLAKFNKNDYVL